MASTGARQSGLLHGSARAGDLRLVLVNGEDRDYLREEQRSSAIGIPCEKRMRQRPPLAAGSVVGGGHPTSNGGGLPSARSGERGACGAGSGDAAGSRTDGCLAEASAAHLSNGGGHAIPMRRRRQGWRRTPMVRARWRPRHEFLIFFLFEFLCS
ncbi:hypothetical protein [Oryza sativa Japonica Group]|uniref:Uncharacterized protein n=1 Tax=Oryza sativa subsp. japonica TaxID=39947 RepID=Q5ZCU9_ORYSJ|nr:hypothetical protein [Oryza sativa Japonica Group]